MRASGRRPSTASRPPTGGGEPQALLAAGVQALGLDLPAAAPALMLRYLGELQKWNAAYNLTAVRDPAAMVTRHLLDSLAVLPLVRGHVLDVGSGAGLPAIPLAIANPVLAVTALDSNGKKTRFMRHAQRTLALKNLEVVEKRVEEFEGGPFDCIVSRAFAALDEFFDKTAHLLAPAGVWLAMKGKLDAQELGRLPATVQIRETHRLRVPGLDEDRHVIIACKP
jgi:16S rRNA (guanine527-N7)-methyltransferase